MDAYFLRSCFDDLKKGKSISEQYPILTEALSSSLYQGRVYLYFIIPVLETYDSSMVNEVCSLILDDNSFISCYENYYEYHFYSKDVDFLLSTLQESHPNFCDFLKTRKVYNTPAWTILQNQ